MKRFNAFTLAEIIAVVVILGVVAAIMIPSTMKRSLERANRSKIKKAVTAYDRVMNNMVVSNNLKSDADLQVFANELPNCEKTSGYFKIIEKYDDESNCKFKTSDKIWWDITNIQNPIIATEKKYLTVEDAEKPTTNNAFYLIGRFDNSGSFRVDDNAYEHSQDNNEQNIASMEKLWNFMNGISPQKEENGGNGNGGDGDGNNNENDNIPRCLTLLSCNVGSDYCVKKEYDSNGNVILESGYNKNSHLSTTKYTYDNNGNKTSTSYNCNEKGELCTNMDKTEYDDNGNKTIDYYHCDTNGCKSSRTYVYYSNGDMTTNLDCDGNGKNCERLMKYRFIRKDDNLSYYEYADCSEYGCTWGTYGRQDYKILAFDSKGNERGISLHCDINGELCYSPDEYRYDNMGNLIGIYKHDGFSVKLDESAPYSSEKWVYDDYGNEIEHYQNCDGEGNNCSKVYTKKNTYTGGCN